MKIKHAMILAAGLGKRMQPITSKLPKPLLQIGGKTLIDRTIDLMTDFGVEELTVNVHHLADKVIEFIKKKKIHIKINISDERKLLLDTGGGIFKGTEPFNENPFIVINPDTIWNNGYLDELNKLEKIFFKESKSSLLLVKKDNSFDTSFKGDFNLSDNLVSRDLENEFIFTGAQILNRKIFQSVNKKIFSMNAIWDILIQKRNLIGIESHQKFYHVNTKHTYDQILKLKSID